MSSIDDLKVEVPTATQETSLRYLAVQKAKFS